MALVMGQTGCGSCFQSTSDGTVGGSDGASDGASLDAASDTGTASDGATATDSAVPCVPDSPALEVCDGRDNDCDGEVDFADCGPNLEAWYRFEEASGTVIDSSGNGWDGTPVGAVDQGFPGPVGDALHCNGVGDHVDVPGGPTFDASGGWTVEAWAGYPEWPANTNALGKASGTYFPDDDIQLIIDGNPVAFANVSWNACDLSHCTSGPGGLQLMPAMSFGHFAMAWDGAFFRLFFNGLEVGSVLDTTFAFGLWDEPLTICGLSAVAGQSWWGVIDEVKFWSIARDEAEICADAGGSYGAGPPATCALP